MLPAIGPHQAVCWLATPLTRSRAGDWNRLSLARLVH